MRVRHLLHLATLAGAGIAVAATAQQGPYGVEQLSPRSGPAIEQLDGASAGPSPLPQLGGRRPIAPAQQGQVATPRAGRDPRLGQLAPRGAAAAPTAQLADRGASPQVASLPQTLVDACEEAAAGRRAPPQGVDCTTVVEAAPPPPQLSAEEALLTNSTERAAQRLANEQIRRGQSADAGEIARRLSIGDVNNAPVAQAVAAQAAAEAAAAAAAAPTAGRPTIVPGGAVVVIPPGGR